MRQDESTMMRWAFEHSSNGKIITDLSGIIRTVNDAFVNMFGYSREEVIGQRTNFLKSRYSTPEFYQEMWRALSERGEWKGEIINRTKGGTEKTCFLTITSIISPAGERLGYLGVEIDLTERKRLEEQIIQGEKLASVGESIATLMHEIRNPLNGIAMNAYMLNESAVRDPHWSDEERESIALVHREVKRLGSLVTNVMSYARRIELHHERVIIADLFDELQELLIYHAEELGVSLTFEEVPRTLLGYFDPDLMKQVLLNLVQNAIDAAANSEPKVVNVSARFDEGPDWQSISVSGRVLLFIVENSGAAIGDDVLENLFKPFFTTKEQGLGLGLATSAKIVRQHHGVIRHAHSTREPYTTVFTVALPS